MLRRIVFLVSMFSVLFTFVSAQSSTATLNGTVTDQNDAVVVGATVTIFNNDTGFKRTVTTNTEGGFSLPFLQPATYQLTVEQTNFATFEIKEITLNVNDQRAIKIQMKTGSVNEKVNVTTEPPLINENPAVATTIDRDFINNLPTNGRSLQTLILLSPGVVNTPAAGSAGQFSVNGNRSNGNNFTVDGVSGNFSSPFIAMGQQGSGSLPATNQQGAFSSLASLDAIQEFSIQTSTFAPEFGRQPGGQISIVTRGGENNFHGSLFEYFRNNAFDANDWFNNKNKIKQPPLRYNNYGGSFGGPIVFPRFGEGGPGIWKGTDKTFFFFTFEGQRFILPQPTVSITVPSLTARQNAPTTISRAFLNAFPIPNGPIVLDALGQPTGAIFTTAYSNQSNSDTYGVRIDHKFNNNFTIFGRVNIANSSATTRNSNNPSYFEKGFNNSKTLTIGANQLFGSKIINEVRVNYSKQLSGGQSLTGSSPNFDGFGGGAAFNPGLIIPSGFTAGVNLFLLNPFINMRVTSEDAGPPRHNIQWQIVDNLSIQKGSHQLKFGGDYRLLLPKAVLGGAIGTALYNSLADVYTDTTLQIGVSNNPNWESQTKSFGFYGQDTWRINKRTTMTYGLRWEINPSPTGRGDTLPVTLLTPPDLSKLDQTGLQLAPIGTPFYETDYTKFAPRFGMSYLVSDKPGRELVVRGGIGVFYDLGQTGFGEVGFPYGQRITTFGQKLPLTAVNLTFSAPNFTPSATNRAVVTVAAADYTLPRTYQWNVTAEQSIGKDQALSVAYVGSMGRKLANTRTIFFGLPGQFPNIYFSTNFSNISYIENAADSDYHSMQVQFTKRLSNGLQVISNYTWSHSIDTASSEGTVTAPGFIFPLSINRGDSNFDVRHNFSTAVTYMIQPPNLGKFGNAIFRNWSLNGIFTARSGLPFTVSITEPAVVGGTVSYRRPNLTGQPLYIADPTVATGRKLNPAAFDFKVPAGQMGSLGRNALRGENFWQLDMSLHRTLKITEKVNIQLRAEAFNVFNHPNFLYPSITSASVNAAGVVTFNPNFGVITSNAANASSSSLFNTGFSPIFSAGGPRSLQLAFRVQF